MIQGGVPCLTIKLGLLPQCLKCRMPVRIIAMPCSSAALLNYLRVADRPAGLYCRCDACLCCGIKAVPEGKKGI